MTKWEKPQVVAIESLPEVYGHCRSGSTQDGSNCATGENTGWGTGHNCLSGGIAALATCNSGGTKTT